jgi:hypothetical protein
MKNILNKLCIAMSLLVVTISLILYDGSRDFLILASNFHDRLNLLFLSNSVINSMVTIIVFGIVVIAAGYEAKKNI